MFAIKKEFMSIQKIRTIGLASILLTSVVACNNQKTTPEKVSENTSTEVQKVSPYEGKIAYVNIDSLEANYLYLKDKQKEMEQKQKQIQNELQRMNTQFQNKLATMQKKYTDGTLTADEAEQTEKELASMQERFERRQMEAQNEMLTLQEKGLIDLQERLNSFIKDYNADKKFAYVLSYGSGGSILFADPQFDITEDVIKGMNAEAQAQESESKKNE